MNARADLSEDSAFLLELLDDTHAWRERLVEEFVFAAASHVRASSSYQIDIPRALVEQYVALDRVRSANVLLPLTTRPKRALLSFDLTGHAGAPAHLLTRKNVAGLQAEYLRRLSETSKAARELRGRLADALLEAVCVFTPDLFRSFADQVQWYRSDRFERALLAYLRSGLDGIPIRLDDIFRWRELTIPTAGILARQLEEPPERFSSSEEILLALPRLDPRPRTVGEIDAIVVGYAEAIRAADEAGDSDLLIAVCEYGRRYEMVVETEIPLLEPATIKIVEDRPLAATRRGWTTQRFALGDARSAHMEARVADPYVCLGRRRVVIGLDGEPIALGPLETARQTDEILSIYSAETERPYYVDVRLRLRPRLQVRLSAWVITLVNVAAAIVALIVGGAGDLYARLALLIVPTTIAAAVALAREQTALAFRLQALVRAGIMLSIVALWTVALAQVLVFRPEVGP